MKMGHAVTELNRVIKRTAETMADASPLQMAKYTMVQHAGVIIDWLTSRFEAELKRPAKLKPPMIGKRPRLGHPGQGRLPGYEHIPTRIFTTPPSKRRKGTGRVTLLNATLEDQIKSLALALNESAAELAERRRLIAITRRYDRKHPGITVREVLELQASRGAEAARKKIARVNARKYTRT